MKQSSVNRVLTALNAAESGDTGTGSIADRVLLLESRLTRIEQVLIEQIAQHPFNPPN